MRFVVATLVLAIAQAYASGPLFVSELLPDRFEEAQEASKVDLSSMGWTKNDMHSGYFNLEQDKGRSTFFWYSSALDGNASAPVLLWLQGGPGASSLFGMFTEIGPFGITNGVIKERPVNWNEHYHLLFLDNPVGTGFSFTDTDAGFANDQYQVGKDLYSALSQFFLLFPGLRSNDFYVTGESFAGKYVPACSFTIHEMNKKVDKKDRINFKGMSIGDGVIGPRDQHTGYGDLLFNLGMIDESERDVFEKYDKKLLALLDQNDTVGAFRSFDEMLNGDFYSFGTYYANTTGMGSNYFNFELSPDATPLGGDFVEWLNTPAVRAKIHVGDRTYVPENQSVEQHFLKDWMHTYYDMLVPILENYKVIVYSGQNDVILGPALTEKFLYGLKWSGQAEYRKAKKAIWRLPTQGPGSKLPDVAGYAREVGNFKQVVIRGAGHMVPGDQPVRGADLITRFVEGRSFAENAQQPMVEASDPVYPPGQITVDLTVDAGTSYKPLSTKAAYTVDQWANGVVGYDGQHAIYGSDNLADMDHVHEWSKTLTSGTYVVDGKDPLMYVCAFSPSANTYPLPPPADWRMGGCCYQFTTQNATNFNGYCSDSKGTCESMCSVTASGTQSDRHYAVHVSGHGPLSSSILV